MADPEASALLEAVTSTPEDVSSQVPQGKEDPDSSTGARSYSYWTKPTTLAILAVLVLFLAAFSVSVFSPTATAPLLMQYGQSRVGRPAEKVLGNNGKYDLTSEDVERLYELAEEENQFNVQQRELRFSAYKKLNLVTFSELFFVPTYPCIHEERFGAWGEGGKWICLVHRNVSTAPVAISIGSRGEFSFEQDIARRLNAFTHTFDFSLRAKAIKKMQSLKFLKFYNAGLAGASEVQTTKVKFKKGFPRANIITVPAMLHMVNATWIDIFKIDCEGCEFGVVEDMTKLYVDKTVPFGQIQVEIHSPTHLPTLRLIRQLEALGYRMFHAEQNPFCKFCYELAFIHTSLVKPHTH